MFFLSLFYEKITNQYLYKIKTKTEKPLKILAAFTFMISAVIIAYMALTGKIIMEENMAYGGWLRTFIYDVSSSLQNPILDILVLLGIIILFKIIFKETKYESKKSAK